VYVYVWLVIDPRLVHHSLGIFTYYFPFSFSTGWPFFREHLGRPGGPAEYAARFLSQLYCFGWAGALIVCAGGLVMCLSTDVLTGLASHRWDMQMPHRMGGPRGMVLRYVPAVLLLVMYGGYTQPLSTMYDSFLKAVSVPELITGAVPISSKSLARAARSEIAVAVDAVTGPALPTVSEPWLQPEP